MDIARHIFTLLAGLSVWFFALIVVAYAAISLGIVPEPSFFIGSPTFA